MKTYRRHNCHRNHRTARTFMNCAIPNNVWIRGTGNIALIAWCRVPSVTLWDNLKDAQGSKEFIDDLGCGGRCVGRHEIVKVEIA